MKKHYTLLFSVLFFIVVAANAQSPGFDFLDINDVKARINANGNNFWDLDSTASFEVPKNSGKTSLFNQSLWFSGLSVSGQLHMAVETYRSSGQDFWPGPVSNVYDSAYDEAWNHVWKINKSTIDSFMAWYDDPTSYPGYVIPQIIDNWPAHGDVSKGQSNYLAPFFDHDGDGNYIPSQGDYPLIRGDQALWFIYNDKRHIHTQSNGSAAGLEFHGMAYAWDCPSDVAVDKTIFLHYEVYNRSTFTYMLSIMNVFTDFNLGDPLDDYVGCDIERGMYYCYNGDSIDGNGQNPSYGSNPPAMGVVVLGGINIDNDGQDNPKYDSQGNLICDYGINGLNFQDGIVDNERYGLSSFIAMNPDDAMSKGVPETGSEFLNYIRGSWKDGSLVLYGGDGLLAGSSYGPQCNFMFPGLSDPCLWGTNGIGLNGPQDWTEEIATQTPGNRAALGGLSGEFTFEPATSKEIDLALLWARPGSGSNHSSIDVLKEYGDTIRSYFLSNTIPCGGTFTGISKPSKALPGIEIKLFPNPCHDVLHIEYAISTQPLEWQIMNIAGQQIKKGICMSSGIIDVGDLPPGLYVAIIESDNTVLTEKFIKR